MSASAAAAFGKDNAGGLARIGRAWLPAIALILLALGLRVWLLDMVPPGWRDDELINSLVISQKFLDGDWAVYYPDASGHEALYHALNAIMLGLFGPGVPGIRWLSAFLGTMTVAATFALARSMWGTTAALLAAAVMALSFWSLMYSRAGIRHMLTPLLALLAFQGFWRGLDIAGWRGQAGGPPGPGVRPIRYQPFVLSALFVGLGFYAYFASRGVPLILLGFSSYLWLFERDLFRQRWRGIVLTLGLGALLAMPLLVSLAQQPEAESRVGELAVPLQAAGGGDLEPLLQHVQTTLNMFHADGDGEWLYNIPHRPVFQSLSAFFFWAGVLTAAWLALWPGLRRLAPARFGATPGRRHRSLAAALLLLWWLAGIAPAFVSVPPASLGHTILALPPTFILFALPLLWLEALPARWQSRAPAALALLLVVTVAARDLPAYFLEWPQRGMVRFLYRADIREVAKYLNDQAAGSGELVPADFGITGLLAGPWDRLALAIDLDGAWDARPRWYDPQRALLLNPPISFSGAPRLDSPFGEFLTPLPGHPLKGDYLLSRVTATLDPRAPVCFANGLCWLSATYDPENHRVALGWQADRPLDLPPAPLVSNPPPPGVYSGPRLLVFAQLQDESGNFLVGDDGLWIDPYTLRGGDQFLQLHQFNLPAGAAPARIVFGLYDPFSGDRITTKDGRDRLQLSLAEIQQR